MRIFSTILFGSVVALFVAANWLNRSTWKWDELGWLSTFLLLVGLGYFLTLKVADNAVGWLLMSGGGLVALSFVWEGATGYHPLFVFGLGIFVLLSTMVFFPVGKYPSSLFAGFDQ